LFESTDTAVARGSVSRVKVVIPSLQKGIFVVLNDEANLIDFVVFEASIFI
jgi:hypothetical protein